MFTNNMDKLERLKFFTNSASNYQTFTNAAGGSCTGRSAYTGYFSGVGDKIALARCQTITGNRADVSYASNHIDIMAAGLYFGTGTTPAAKTDYTLESPITSGLSFTSPSSPTTTDCGGGKYEVSAAHVVANTTAAEINIYEFGLFVPTCTRSSILQTSGDTLTLNLIMVERTVLSEPINIQPGESKLVTYKITFNHTS